MNVCGSVFRYLIICAAVTLLAIGNPLHVAAAPPTINFQGFLKDTSENPVTSSSLSMTFRLFNVLSGGTALWTETQSVQVSEGKYNVVLGDSTALSPSFFTGDNLWLEIQVASDVLSPRQKLSSVAYALNVSDNLAAGSVTTTHIEDGTITAADLAFSPLSTPYTGDVDIDGIVIATGDIRTQQDIEASDVYVGGEYGENDDAPTNGDVWVRNSLDNASVHLESDEVDGGSIAIFGPDGYDELVEIEEDWGGGAIKIYDGSGDASSYTIRLWGDYQDTGNGRININGNEINDYAEYFNLTDATEIQPGMVVSIDPENAGFLKLTAEPYDKKVIGIVSGAGGKMPGMIIGGQNEENSNKPIAVSGMVYCYVDATRYPIEAGDLLTTSDISGFAMKAVDQYSSHGAILGKAMEGISEGEGLILVFVTLQ